jgi:hypothetical protein
MQPTRLYWFMVLDRLWPWSRYLLGLTLFVTIGGGLSIPLDLWHTELDHDAWLDRLGICLFFAFINAYALATMAAVIERTQLALDQLRPELDLDDHKFRLCRESLTGGSTGLLVTIALISLGAGLAHNLILAANGENGSPTESDGSGTALVVVLWFATSLTWFVLLHVITALVLNARLFARIGRDNITVDIFRPGQLAAFGTVALLPSMTLMGTQIAYPLLFLGQSSWLASLPGFLSTLVAVTYLMLRPTWAVHVHLREARRALLLSTDAAIARWRKTNPHHSLAHGAVQEISQLLLFRSQVNALREWPFDIQSLLRWLFYLTIPPLTWILAALMEDLVDHWTA